MPTARAAEDVTAVAVRPLQDLVGLGAQLLARASGSGPKIAEHSAGDALLHGHSVTTADSLRSMLAWQWR